MEVGKLADLVLWQPAFFGVRPSVVLKGGMIAWAAMGDSNASIPTPQPVLLDALSMLEGHPGVSLVLNQSLRSATSAYYYYGYGEDSQSPQSA